METYEFTSKNDATSLRMIKNERNENAALLSPVFLKFLYTKKSDWKWIDVKLNSLFVDDTNETLIQKYKKTIHQPFFVCDLFKVLHHTG
jgi:hypothetical protein